MRRRSAEKNAVQAGDDLKVVSALREDDGGQLMGKPFSLQQGPYCPPFILKAIGDCFHIPVWMAFGGEEKVQGVGFDGTDLRVEVSIDFLHL